MSDTLRYAPGATLRLETYAYPTSQVGTIGVRLRSLSDRSDTIPRTTAGIAFDATTGAHWIDTLTAPMAQGDYDALFDIGEAPPWPSQRISVAGQALTVQGGDALLLETYAYPTSQVGTIGVRLRSLADRTDTIARTTSGIAWDSATSAHWTDTIIAPATAGEYDALFDIGEAPPWPSQRIVVTAPPAPSTNLLADIREAIAAAITTAIPDLQCSPYVLANGTPPCAWVARARPQYDLAMNRGLDEWTVSVQAFVGQTLDIAAQVRLDELLEPSSGKSMKEAIEADTTLGGLLGPGGCHVTDSTGAQEFQVQGRGPWLGAEWTLLIRADGG